MINELELDVDFLLGYLAVVTGYSINVVGRVLTFTLDHFENVSYLWCMLSESLVDYHLHHNIFQD
jgi:hypothetical protein